MMVILAKLLARLEVLNARTGSARGSARRRRKEDIFSGEFIMFWFCCSLGWNR